MKTRFFSPVYFLALFLFTFFSLQIKSSGFIIIDPYVPITQKSMPLIIKKHNVTVSIDNQVATTKITQIFHNPNDYETEGTYIFPVPQNVSISNFTMLANKRLLNAQILDKNKARQIYEGIVRKRKNPALLEYVGRDMIKARVCPIPAHSNIHISFEYSEILTADNGSIKYRHSLKNYENYHKNSKEILDSVSITVQINSQKNIVNLYSPTHDLSIKKNGRTKAIVNSTERDVRSSRDFILYYTIPQNEIGFNILTYKENEKDGFFLAMMAPNISTTRQPIIGKNIVFVVDRSGSMGRAKMKQAKDALQFCLQNLNEQDHFNIISFDDRIDLYKDELIQANHNQIQQALSYIDTLHARGCTYIDGALKKALQQLHISDNPNMIIFLTDGLPNVGESNVTRIIENAERRNSTNTRIFSFGVGYDVNTTLLDKISLDNKGSSDYVRPSENIESVVSNFYKKVANPVLTDLHLQVSGTEIAEIFPINLPDLFHGSQLLVLGRYTNGGNVTLHLSGKQNKVEKEYIFNTQFAKNDIINDFLPRLWATRKIAYLIDTIVLEGKNKKLVNEIIMLSKKYGIITEYTSFLIDANAEQFSRNEISLDMSDMAFDCLYDASQDQIGKNAVVRAKKQETLRVSTNCSNICSDVRSKSGATAQQKIRAIGARTFYLKDDVWIDADHTESSPITKVKLFSTEYFELVKTRPDISTYLALGNNIIIKTISGSIQIYDDKK